MRAAIDKSMKYKIWFVNFNYYSQDEFGTLEEALRKARASSFEYRIDYDSKPVYCGSCFYERAL